MNDQEEHNGTDEQEQQPRSMGTSRLPDPDDFDFSSIEMPSELAPTPAPVTAATPAAPKLEASTLPPAIERTRAQRDPFVPRWVIPTVLGVLAAVFVIVVAAVLITTSSRVVVPDVTGRSFAEAKATLTQAGFEVVIEEQQFSSEVADTVLSQSPAGGHGLAAGKTVRLVVSAGIEEFSMPDVVGDGLTLARGVLEERGLAIRVENVTSDEASNTVLSTIPAAGATVRSGDVVRVQVASPEGSDTTLRRYDLQGVSIIVDAGNPAKGKDDVALDIARRIRSLVEASGGTVGMIRTDDGASMSESLRAQAAQTTSATVGVGLSLRTGGKSGRTVTGNGQASKITSDFPDVMLSEVQLAVPPASTGSDTDDDVFGSALYPWSRIVIGSWAAPDDDAAFEDPRWADGVARAVYSALGKSFGRRIEQ